MMFSGGVQKNPEQLVPEKSKKIEIAFSIFCGRKICYANVHRFEFLRYDAAILNLVDSSLTNLMQFTRTFPCLTAFCLLCG